MTDSMQNIVDVVLRKIKQMPDDEFAKKLVQCRKDEVAVTLRYLQGGENEAPEANANQFQGSQRRETDLVENQVKCTFSDFVPGDDIPALKCQG